MKKTLSLVMALFLFCAMCLTSCGSGGSSTTPSKTDSPSDIVEKAANLIINKDYENLVLLYEGGETATDDEKAVFIGLCQMAKEYKACEVLEETIAEDGETAKVKVKYTYPNGKEKNNTVKLVKTENGWRLKM